MEWLYLFLKSKLQAKILASEVNFRQLQSLFLNKIGIRIIE